MPGTNSFSEHFQKQPDEILLNILKKPGDYDKLAVEAAGAELRLRGIATEDVVIVPAESESIPHEKKSLRDWWEENTKKVEGSMVSTFSNRDSQTLDSELVKPKKGNSTRNWNIVIYLWLAGFSLSLLGSLVQLFAALKLTLSWSSCVALALNIIIHSFAVAGCIVFLKRLKLGLLVLLVTLSLACGLGIGQVYQLITLVPYMQAHFIVFVGAFVIKSILPGLAIITMVHLLRSGWPTFFSMEKSRCSRIALITSLVFSIYCCWHVQRMSSIHLTSEEPGEFEDYDSAPGEDMESEPEPFE